MSRSDSSNEWRRWLQGFVKKRERSLLPLSIKPQSLPVSSVCVGLLMTPAVSSRPPGDAAAAPQNQEGAPVAPPLVGEDAELVEQLRKVRASVCYTWCSPHT